MSDAQNTIRFTGREKYTLDEKGRVTIPKHWRLKGDQEEKWHLVPASSGECVRLMEHWKFRHFVQKAEETYAHDQEALRFFRSSFVGEAADAEPDKQGRIAIPKGMCDDFGLSGEVWMRGAGDLIEIWNKARFEAQLEAQRARYREIGTGIGV